MAQEQLEHMQAQFEHLKVEYEILKKHMDETHKSLSWRITKPLRLIKRLINNIISKEYHKIQYACPICGTVLAKDLSCLKCNFLGYEKNGMIYLHRGDETWEKCEVERDGWINMTKNLGLYKENSDYFYMPDGLPHLKKFFAESKQHVDKLLEIENLDNKVCLDLGASIGWVEAYILKTYKNAKLIALEVNDDFYIGLGRSAVLKEYHNCSFESVVADMHHIPLPDDSIDIVFTVDALHHFRDIRQVYEEIYRVLKPSGKFYAINEPDRPDGTDEKEFVEKYIHLELENNIIERRPTLQEYIENGRLLNLKTINQEIGLKKDIDTCGLFLLGEKSV